jgi:hypothetical protein
MFAPGAVERRLSMVVGDEYHREYVDGIVEDYITPSLTDPGCYYSEFAVSTPIRLPDRRNNPRLIGVLPSAGSSS